MWKITKITPFWVFSGGNPLRRQYNLQIPLDVLVVSFERVIHVEALDPGSIDLDLVDIIRRVIIFLFILVLLLLLLILLAHIVCILARGARIILLLLFLCIHGSLIHLPNRPRPLNRVRSHRPDQIIVKSSLQLLPEEILLLRANYPVFSQD